MGMWNWLQRVVDGARKEPALDPHFAEICERFRTAEANGWWRDMTGLVGETDQQLVVIGPRANVTAEDLQILGQLLACWQAEFPQARHIWGLTDLLNGLPPRTPPIYLAVPYPVDGFEERYESVALVYVARGADIETALRSLVEQLGDFQSKLFCFETPEQYSLHNR